MLRSIICETIKDNNDNYGKVQTKKAKQIDRKKERERKTYREGERERVKGG